MDALDESAKCSHMIDCSTLLSQVYWDHHVKSNVPLENCKHMVSSDIKSLESKAKDKMLDQLEKEVAAIKTLEESVGSKASLSIEEISELCVWAEWRVLQIFTQKILLFWKA